MALFPGKEKAAKLADGGKLALGYESQLGATLSKDGAGAAVGDTLYQNLPPLAVPYISVKRADLDGIRAEAAAQSDEKADKLKEQVAKFRDTALKDANISKAAARKVAAGYDGILEEIGQDLKQDRFYFNNPANRASFEQRIAKGMNFEALRGYKNSYLAVTDQGKQADGQGQLDFAAYDKDGKRQYKTLRELHQDYLENGDAITDPFTYTFRRGNEKDAQSSWQSKINTIESSTNGGVDWRNTGVHVGDLAGSSGEKYLISQAGSQVTTSNAAHINGLRAGLIGYNVKDKHGKVIGHKDGNWEQFFTEEDIHGLKAPRQQRLDDAMLVPGEHITVSLTGQDGQSKPVDISSLSQQQNLTRRQLLQQLQGITQNPQAPAKDKESAQHAIEQLEANRDKMVKQQVTTMLAEHLGLKLQQGTVSHFSQSASHLPTAKEKAAEGPGSGLFTGVGEGSAGVDKFSESFPMLTPDGRPEQAFQMDASGNVITDKSGNRVTYQQKFNAAAAPFGGSQSLRSWADNTIIRKAAGADGKQGTTQLTLSQVEQGQATYLITPQGARVIQGGGLGRLPNAAQYRVISHNDRVVYMPLNPNGGMAEHNAQLAASQQVQATLNKLDSQRAAGKLTDSQYAKLRMQLDQRAQHDGLRPYLDVTVRAPEAAIKETAKLGVKNDERDAGRFGYVGKDGKPIRPDQFIGNGYWNSDEGKLREVGWEESADREDDKQNNGDQYGLNAHFTARMLIPVPGMNLNTSSKSEDAALGEAEYNRTAAEAASSTRFFDTNNWGGLRP